MPNRKKNKWWRPSVISEAVVGKLEEFFRGWCNVTQACLYAWISRDTFYDWMDLTKKFSDKKCKKTHEDFVLRMLRAQQYASVWCRRSVVKKGIDWDWKAAAWWLEKKDTEFKEKKWDITINNNMWFTSIEIIDATGKETSSATNTETTGTSEELSG